MKKLIFLAFLFACLTSFSQNNPLYVAAKSGLSIREKPDPTAAVLGKIPYGARVTIAYPDESVKIVTEGMQGEWAKVTYNGKSGFIVNSYLFSVPPPKAGTKTMKEYLAQLSAPFGAKLVVKNGSFNQLEEGGSETIKQLYKNGAEWQEFHGYEYGGAAYLLPNFGFAQGFLLMRLIPEFDEYFKSTDEFPAVSKTVKKGDIEYRIKVESEQFGDFTDFKKISMEFEDGAFYNFEMYSLGGQLVIFIDSGV